MAERCGCKPGTYEGGLHEERSEACQRAESEAFAGSLDALARSWRQRGLLPEPTEPCAKPVAASMEPVESVPDSSAHQSHERVS